MAVRVNGPIIAIDGPVGAGKSTVARALARALGLKYLNTGAMYRAVALAAQASGLTPDTPNLEAALSRLLAELRIDFDGDHLLLDGRDVSSALSEPRIGDLASRLSTLAVVRERMRDLQRAAGSDGGIVMEGRDIGTVIFPDADYKFFLDAAVEERARRRYQELSARGDGPAYSEVLEQLRERDRRDRERALAPLAPAHDAIMVDSTGRSVDEIVAMMQRHIERGVAQGLKQGYSGCKDSS
jgi:cytidylate kinase